MRKMGLIRLITSIIVVVSVLAACAPGGQKERITVGGGTVGGVSNLWANCFAAIVTKNVDVEATVVTYSISAMQDGVLADSLISEQPPWTSRTRFMPGKGNMKVRRLGKS